jgi:hypothetical protein
MPQKKAKKAKAEKPKKSVKSESKTAKPSGLGAALKKAAKDLGKKLTGSGNGAGKKPAPAPAAKKAVPPLKAAKKGAELPKKAAPPPPPPAAAKGKKPASPLSIVKDKKEAVSAPKGPKGASPKIEGKKKSEVVVVVPAPKGVAMLTKEGKKKGKASAEGSVSKRNRCREPGCDHDFILVGYCRLHYIKNWRRIKRKESILASGQLNNYVEELVNKYPDKYLDVIRQDLATEKEWGKVVTDLELEGADEDSGVEEDTDAVPEGVRATTGGGGARGEFDDEGDAF